MRDIQARWPRCFSSTQHPGSSNDLPLHGPNLSLHRAAFRDDSIVHKLAICVVSYSAESFFGNPEGIRGAPEAPS